MRWAEIRVAATEASADAASNIMIEERCAGTAAGRPLDSSETGAVDVFGYLPVDDRLEARLQNIRSRVRLLPDFGLQIRSDEISVKWVEDEEWATAWRRFFRPIRIGSIVVKPSWEDLAPCEGDIVVEIDPGMAFGTGNHPTTRLCLIALQECITGGEFLLDVGTGSGILAIAGAKLGASRVVGLDCDPLAVSAAAQNVERAGLTGIIRIEQADSPSGFEGCADVVAANIVSDVIMSMAENLRDALKPGRKLVTSGIVAERVDEVRTKLESVGLKTLEDRRDGEWAALIMRR